jgi:hypothetical protein
MTERRKPSLRRQNVPTSTFGDVIVRQLMSSDRIVLKAPTRDDYKRIEGEGDDEYDARTRRHYARFLAHLLHLAVVEPLDGTPVHSTQEWDEWSASNEDGVAGEVFKLLQMALEFNGYRTLPTDDAPAEDPAKNG